jgi:hypothetical protein
MQHFLPYSSSLGILHATSLMFVLFGDKHISTVSPVSPITFITFFLIAIVHVALKARSYLTLILGVKMTMTPGRKLLEDGLGI